jgi:transcriptional regulator with XRE-family HTH domain
MTRKSVTAFDKRLGQRLRQGRLLKGLTQQQIGDIAGVSWQQVQKYEAGENRIAAERLYRVSKKLGLSLAFFLESDRELDCQAEALSDEALRLAGHIEALPDRLVRYSVSSLVSSIARAWDERERM